MSQDQKFNQLWEFRRRDDDIDSSDDSKSNSQFEPVLKKHKLISNLILPQEDETSDSQKTPQFDPNTGSHFGSVKKTRAMKSKQKKGGNRKNKCSVGSQVLASMEGLKSFMESILEELRVEREKMFEQMKEEMKDCVGVESVSKPTRKRGGGARKKKAGPVNPGKKSGDLGTKTTPDSNSLERSVISNNKTLTDSNNCQKVVDGQVNDKPITPSEENQNLSIKKPNYSSNEIVSSSYLTLPSILSEPQRSLKNVEVNANDASENFEQGNSRNGEDLGFYDQQFGPYGQMCSKDLGFYDQQSVQTTTNMSNGWYAVPFHQRLDSGFSNRNTSNNVLGLRMNGNILANNFRSYMNHKVDGRVHAFGTQDLKDGQFYPK